MDAIKDSVELVLGLKGKKNDDFYDRLSYRYSSALLVVFAAVVTVFQLSDYPITCWLPVHFHDSHGKFANSYCWVKNTYYLPYEEHIPDHDEPRQTVTYYQWVPFILLGQALLFKLPGMLWNALNSKAGLDADDIMVSAGKLDKAVNEENREGIVDILTKQLDRFLAVRGGGQEDVITENKCKRCLTACCHCCGQRFGSYLTVLFLFIKLLYIANALAQLFVLGKVLNTSYSTYGVEVMKGMAGDHDWQETPYVAFPRVTMCDFSIRRLGNTHRYTLQCTLPLNMINEKIYIFLWFWLFVILIGSAIGFLQWFIRALARKDRRVFLTNHLGCSDKVMKDNFTDELHVEEFMDDYLKQDGQFILRLISHNTNNMTTRTIISSLWECWYARRDERNRTLGRKLLPDLSKHKLDLDEKEAAKFI